MPRRRATDRANCTARARRCSSCCYCRCSRPPKPTLVAPAVAAQDPDIRIVDNLPGFTRAVTEQDLEPLLRCERAGSCWDLQQQQLRAVCRGGVGWGAWGSTAAAAKQKLCTNTQTHRLCQAVSCCTCILLVSRARLWYAARLPVTAAGGRLRRAKGGRGWCRARAADTVPPRPGPRSILG